MLALSCNRYSLTIKSVYWFRFIRPAFTNESLLYERAEAMCPCGFYDVIVSSNMHTVVLGSFKMDIQYTLSKMTFKNKFLINGPSMDHILWRVVQITRIGISYMGSMSILWQLPEHGNALQVKTSWMARILALEKFCDGIVFIFVQGIWGSNVWVAKRYPNIYQINVGQIIDFSKLFFVNFFGF